MTWEIKVCGITDREGLMAAAEAGATAVGFVFAPSSRRVGVGEAAALAAAAPASVCRVAVFRHPDPEEVARVLAEVRVDRVQSDAEDYAALRPVLGGTPFMPVYRDSADLGARLASRPAVHERVLIEGPVSGSGRMADWARIGRAARGPFILAGGLTPENVAEAIRVLRPAGVDASSGLESSPGVKDPARIAAFVAKARTAFAEGGCA